MKTPTTCENTLCKNPNCTCDPCLCTAKKCCNEGSSCSKIMNYSGNQKGCCFGYSWCGPALRIAIAVGLIIAAFVLGLSLGNHKGGDRDSYMHHEKMMDEKIGGKKDKMAEHCQMMPDMIGCEKYKNSGAHTMDMSDPMSMSMADMNKMMAGKTGDALDRAFLEGMIPHHQGAVDMAQMLAGSKHPELVKFGAEIIATQQKEIDQMRQWMKDWGYTSSGKTNSGTNMSGMNM